MTTLTMFQLFVLLFIGSVVLKPIKHDELNEVKRGVDNSGNEECGCGGMVESPDGGRKGDMREGRKRKYQKNGVITWTFKEDDEKTMYDFLRQVEYAMNRWASQAAIKFEYIPWEREQEKVIDITLMFARRVHGSCQRPFDGKGGEVAHIVPMDDDTYEIHLDGEEDWKTSEQRSPSSPFIRTKQGPDFIQNIIHQVGHSLGFHHNEKDKDSVMHCPYFVPEKVNDVYKLPFNDTHQLKAVKGECRPPKVDSMYFDTNENLTYANIGPYMYQFKRPTTNSIPHPFTVNQTWPRLSYNVWSSFKRDSNIDEIFIHSDGNTYLFSGEKYNYRLGHRHNPSKTLGHKSYYIGENKHKRNKHVVIGWPGLKHYKYIDAAVSFGPGSRTYLFQDEWVYLWDSDKKTSNPEDHWPKGAVADGWPREIKEVFPGVPNKIDTAFHLEDRVYFFKDISFWELIISEQEKGAMERHVYKVEPAMRPTYEKFKNLCNIMMCVDQYEQNEPCLAAWLGENEKDFRIQNIDLKYQSSGKTLNVTVSQITLTIVIISVYLSQNYLL